MFKASRVNASWVIWGWFALVVLAVGVVLLAGPAAARIALLSKSHGLVLDFGSLYAICGAALLLATMLVIHWRQVGVSGLTGLPTAEGREATALGNSKRIAILGAYGLAAIIASYLILVRHGGTLIATMEHDTFVYYDGAHRFDAGQTQHIDFHTPMGFMCNLLPYWGLKLAGEYAGSLEIASLIAGAFFTAIGAVVLATRFPPVVSIPVLIYLCLLTVVPLGVDEYPEEISHSMFYNRFGWVGVTLVFLMFLEPQRQDRLAFWLDSVCLAALLFFLFYLKITYFLISAAFLPVLFFASPYNRKVALLSFGLFLPAVGIIELAYGINGPYARDIIMAIRSSGANRGAMIPKMFGNFKDFLIVGLAVCLAWSRGVLKLPLLAYIGFVAAAGVAIIDQNTHSRGVICWLAILATMYEVIRRNPTEQDRSQPVTKLACLMSLGLLLIFITQQMVFRGAALGIIRSAVNQIDSEMPGGLEGIVFTEQMQELNLSKKKASPQEKPASPGALPAEDEEVTYVDTVLDGVDLLEEAGTKDRSISALDFVNPFSFILGTRPPNGDHTCIHYGRTMNDGIYSPPEELLGDADYVMIPRLPRVPATTEFLVRTYTPYLKEHFEQHDQSKYWTLWSRKEAAGAAN